MSAREVLELLSSDPHFWPALIDVRSESEFAEGALPGFKNIPILRNPERHEVGITYKSHGQAQAIELGHRLVGPHRSTRVAAWSSEVSSSRTPEAWVCCWRGGLRSSIAAQWVREAGCRARTIEGGYKAIRRLILESFSSSERLPEIWILSGMTGSGKTRLLRELPDSQPKIDLEGLANHRGSAFGLRLGQVQPSQASFENRLGVALWEARGPVLLEDESRLIGSCLLPIELKSLMSKAPVICLEIPREQRVLNIYREYVAEPLASGVPDDAILAWLLRSLEAIAKKLGGERFQAIKKDLLRGIASGSAEGNASWIDALLLHYYDPMYQHAFERQGRKVLCRGSCEEVSEFLLRSVPASRSQ